jgi:hypothetical protein
MTFPTDAEMMAMYGSEEHPSGLVVGTRLVALDSNDPDEPYGWHLALDLAGCELDRISSGDCVRWFGAELCTVIDMKPYGEPWAERFGLGEEKTKGYTGVQTGIQLVETSSIVIHLAEADRSAFAEIFSCKPFDPADATRFTARYFGATAGRCTFTVRQAPDPAAGWNCNFPMDLRDFPGAEGGEVHLSGSAARGAWPGHRSATEPGA